MKNKTKLFHFLAVLILSFSENEFKVLQLYQTNANVELTNDIGNLVILVSWQNDVSQCSKSCSDAVGHHRSGKVAKYGKLSGKCECFLVHDLLEFADNPAVDSTIYLYEGNQRAPIIILAEKLFNLLNNDSWVCLHFYV